MSRIKALIGGTAVAGIAVTAHIGVERLTAQQPTAEVCSLGVLTPEQQQRRKEAIALARGINTAEMRVFVKTKTYQALSALPDITVPDGLSAQIALTESGYIFSVKDASNRVGCALFSDQSGLIYDAQPLR